MELMLVTVESPFGRVEFEGEEGFVRKASFQTRHRLMGEPLELVRATSTTPVDIPQRMQINAQLRQLIRSLPRPTRPT